MRAMVVAMTIPLVACATDSAERSDEPEPAGPEHADTGEGHGHGHGHGHGGMPHRFSDVARWVGVFDDPARAAWQKPAEVAELMAVSEGMTVADVGAGTGYMLPHLRAAAGDTGRVLALDIEPNLVAHMTERITEAGWKNVEARQVAADDPGLAPGSVDRVLLVNTWHHVADRRAYLAKLVPALKPDGAIVIVEYTLDSPKGPPPGHRLGAEALVAELGATGLRHEIVAETLPYQYVIVLRRR